MSEIIEAVNTSLRYTVCRKYYSLSLLKKGMEELFGYIHEPNDLQCGQAVLAMLLDVSVESICTELQNDRETAFREMKQTLEKHGFKLSPERKQAFTKADLPVIALLSLETPRCWHWSLYAEGIFYDPEHGVMEDFPECKRKYFWEITI